MQVYMDNSATTRPLEQVASKVNEVMMSTYANPSSLHRMGMDAEKLVRAARQSVAGAMGAEADEIFFTSGGTESNNWALTGGAAALRRRGSKIITTAAEHPAILEPCKLLEQQGFHVVHIPVDDECRPDMDALRAETDGDTILISAMHVNNETGAVSDIDQIAQIKEAAEREAGHRILMHADCVQSFGKLPLSTGAIRGLDMISVSGHKIHGPKGTGALYVRSGAPIRAMMAGGGQEGGMRSGTENVPGIAGLGLAAEHAAANMHDAAVSMQAVRDHMLCGIRDEIDDIRVNSPEDGACSILNISFLGTRGEVILHMLEDDGIYVSTGSACSSNKKGRSHVLTAMGLPQDAIEGAIRFSFSAENTIDEAEYVLDRLKSCVGRFRRLGSFRQTGAMQKG